MDQAKIIDPGVILAVLWLALLSLVDQYVDRQP